jgi:O-antigen ligase
MNGIRFLRAYGLTDHPNILGGFLAVGMLILLGAFVIGLSNKHKSNWTWLVALAFIPAAIALLLTFSRSGWAAFALGSLLIFSVEVWRRNLKAVRLGLLLGIVSTLVALPIILRNRDYLSARFNSANSFSNNRVERGSIIERIYLYHSADLIFKNNYLNGVGLGGAVVALKEVYPEFYVRYQPPHVTTLVAAMETGVFGAILYVSLIVIPFYDSISRWKDYVHNPVLIISLACILALMVIGLFDHYLWTLTSGRFFQWLVWGCYAAARFRADSAPNGE